MHNQITVMLILLLLSLSVGNAIANEPAPGGCSNNELFISITSDDTWRASMALNFALKNLMGENGLEAPRPVTIFLNVEGVRLAISNDVLPHDTYGLTGKRPDEVLATLIDQKARVIVCPSCLERSGFKPNQVIQGAYVGGPAPQILECSTTQLSY